MILRSIFVLSFIFVLRIQGLNFCKKNKMLCSLMIIYTTRWGHIFNLLLWYYYGYITYYTIWHRDLDTLEYTSFEEIVLHFSLSVLASKFGFRKLEFPLSRFLFKVLTDVCIWFNPIFGREFECLGIASWDIGFLSVLKMWTHWHDIMGRWWAQ